MLRPCLDSLPNAQCRLWPCLEIIPRDFILYGGTAIAIRLGHRDSVDFDVFSSRPWDTDALIHAVSTLPRLVVTRRNDRTLVCRAAALDNDPPVTVAFYWALRFGQLAPPDTATDTGVAVASLLDLLAHKLKTLLDRAEGKDYADIAALLDAGESLANGLAGADRLFHPGFPAMSAIKALTWFDDVAEPWRLTPAVRETLARAVETLPARIPPLSLQAETLGP